MVYVWHHADDAAEPSWEPFAVPEMTSSTPPDSRWVYRGRTEYEVTAHIQDLPENGADVAHLPAIHTNSMLSGGDLTHWINGLFGWHWHEWNISWTPQTEEGQKHIAHIDLVHALKMGKLSLMDIKVTN